MPRKSRHCLRTAKDEHETELERVNEDLAREDTPPLPPLHQGHPMTLPPLPDPDPIPEPDPIATEDPTPPASPVPAEEEENVRDILESDILPKIVAENPDLADRLLPSNGTTVTLLDGECLQRAAVMATALGDGLRHLKSRSLLWRKEASVLSQDLKLAEELLAAVNKDWTCTMGGDSIAELNTEYGGDHVQMETMRKSMLAFSKRKVDVLRMRREEKLELLEAFTKLRELVSSVKCGMLSTLRLSGDKVGLAVEESAAGVTAAAVVAARFLPEFPNGAAMRCQCCQCDCRVKQWGGTRHFNSVLAKGVMSFVSCSHLLCAPCVALHSAAFYYSHRNGERWVSLFCPECSGDFGKGKALERMEELKAALSRGEQLKDTSNSNCNGNRVKRSVAGTVAGMGAGTVAGTQTAAVSAHKRRRVREAEVEKEEDGSREESPLLPCPR